MANLEASTTEEQKRQAGYRAVDDYVKSGMLVSLGTGSTAFFAVERLGQKLKSGELKDIEAVPTSERTKEQAEKLGIPLTTLDVRSDIDLAINGADNVDPDFHLLKGGGGALFREKMTELAAKKFIVVVDESKVVDRLGANFPIPVEITPFTYQHTIEQIKGLRSLAGCDPQLRMGSIGNTQKDGDKIAVTDNGNYIVDLFLKEPLKDDPVQVAAELKKVVGVLEHGLFISMASAIVVATKDGVQVKQRIMPVQDELKKRAGYRAVDDYVKSGMVVGLGTGSTAYFAVERVGQKLKSGELKDIVAIPTSIRTKEQAESLGIPLTTLDEKSVLDVAIDGADSIDPDFNLVKGGGGALFREKKTEIAAKLFVVIVDESKETPELGPHFPVPVEITPFMYQHTIRTIKACPSLGGCEPVLRMGNVANNKKDGDNIAVTDNGNYIVDLVFKQPIKDPVKMGHELKRITGVLEHGLFIGMTRVAVVATSEGVVVKEKPQAELFNVPPRKQSNAASLVC